MKSAWIAVIALVVVSVAPVRAAVPAHISYQGKLTDAVGAPVPDASYPIEFGLFTTATGGTAAWSSGPQTVSVSGGLFHYLLGQNSAFPGGLFANPALWLQITVDGEVVAPRTPFNSVAYAFSAARADTAMYTLSGNGWSAVGNTLITAHQGDSVSIGSEMHRAALNVRHPSSSPGDTSVVVSTSDGVAVHVEANAQGSALHAEAAGTGYAGLFEGKVRVNGNTEFFGSITTEGVDQAASWNVGYGTGDAVYGGVSGTGKCFRAERAGGPTGFLCGPDTALYANSQGSGYAAVLSGRVRVHGNSEFFGSITTEGVDQAASWNVGYGTGDAVYGGVSGTGKCFRAERAGGSSAYICGPDTALYVNGIGSAVAARIVGDVEVAGRLGAGVAGPDANLQVAGGNWNVGATEGDFKIGNAATRFKIGIAMSGGGAGDVRMRSHGGSGRLILGSGLKDVLTVNDSLVGIGTLTPNYALDVRGSIGNNTTLYHSDRRWKSEIRTLDHALDKVRALRGVSYRWRRDAYPEMRFPEGEKVGVIAQEVEQVLPDLVHEDASGYKSVEYANMVAVLIEAVKELSAQNEELSRRLERLESERPELSAALK